MATCPVCSTTHPIVRGTPTDCVAGLAGRVSSLESRVTTVESLLGQKVCFTTHEALEQRVGAIEKLAFEPTIVVPAATPAGPGETPIVEPAPEPLPVPSDGR